MHCGIDGVGIGDINFSIDQSLVFHINVMITLESCWRNCSCLR